MTGQVLEAALFPPVTPRAMGFLLLGSRLAEAAARGAGLRSADLARE